MISVLVIVWLFGCAISFESQDLNIVKRIVFPRIDDFSQLDLDLPTILIFIDEGTINHDQAFLFIEVTNVAVCKLLIGSYDALRIIR